jgi:adenylate cyclase
VITDGGDLFGDGVNIAARLEGIAEPGGISLSEDAYRQVEGKIDAAFEYSGQRQLKNIAKPVRVYRLRPDASVQPSAPALPLPDKPSIAVLPFDNMSDDPGQDYFADGMAEDIITALSRCAWLFVIARNSSFTYKGRAVDIREVGRELGVRYVLEGSVRRAGNRIRFTTQLIEAASGNHVWADRFDGELNDVFELQDRITEKVIGSIEPNVQLAEIARLTNKRANLDAYDLLLRAQQLEYEFTEQSLTAALQHLEQALRIDPSYAPAMALAACCHAERRYQGWSKDSQAEAAEGLRLAARAIELGKDDGNVLWMAALAAWHLGPDAQRAKELAYRSLEVNPNSAVALGVAAWVEAVSDNATHGLELFRRADRLSPRDPHGWIIAGGMGVAHYVLDDFEAAAACCRRALLHNPRFVPALRYLAASLALIGRRDEAAAVLQDSLRIEPLLSLSTLKARNAFMTERVWRRYAEGLRLAGLPE